MKKIFFIIIPIILIGGAYIYYNRSNQGIHADVPTALPYKEFQDLLNQNSDQSDPVNTPTNEQNTNQNDQANTALKPENQAPSEVAKTSINLAVPFTSQAPTANWNEPFQDACEEAAILMADYYLRGLNMPSPQQVEDTLVAMIDWEGVHMNGDIDMSISELAYFAKNYLGYQNYDIVEDLTADKIRSYLDEGLPVIVPANGKRLANPNFRNGGPIYHMLVVKGYVEDKFITNDPGTRKGADFIYTVDNLMYSIADWNEKEHQASGAKRALVLLPD